MTSTSAVSGSAARVAACVVLAVCVSGCAAARLTGRPPIPPLPPPGPVRTVVVEPFFEDAAWVQKTETDYAQVFDMYGGLQDVQVYRTYAEKPLYAKLDALAVEQKKLIAELRRRRPQWRVLSTGDLPAVTGPVTLVRVVLGQGQIVASNRTLLSLAFGFGFLLPPLWLFELNPVTESQNLSCTVQRYDADAATLRSRLVRYATQPDFAVDTRGIPGQTLPLSTEFQYQEGLFASEDARVPAITEGVAQRLAAFIVAVLDAPRR